MEDVMFWCMVIKISTYFVFFAGGVPRLIVCQLDVVHADLVSVVDDGSSRQSHQQHAGRGAKVRREAGRHSGLVMVTEL